MPSYEIVIKLAVQDAAGQEREVEAILDSGFNGSLTLPPGMIANLGLPLRSRSSAIRADGSVQQLNVHAGMIVWDGRPRPILSQAIDSYPLIGMALLVGFDLRARVIAGGVVQIEAVP